MSIAMSGNPFMQEEALREGRAYVAFSELEVLEVSGDERLSWLHNLTTAPFAAPDAPKNHEALVLSPSGYIRFACAAWDDGSSTWLVTERGQAEPLAQFLDSMRFTMRVQVQAHERAVYGVMLRGADIPENVAELAQWIWEDPWPRTLPGGTHYGLADADHPGWGVARSLLVVHPQDTAQIEEAFAHAQMPEVRELAWEAARIVDRRPRPSMEIVDERVLPHELDWLRTAVSLTKGCYPGQETVSKVINMGRPPRRLTFLYLEGPEGDLPEHGAPITLDGDTVGVLTSSVRDYEEGAVALGLLKRSVPVDAVVQIDNFVASQEVIVSAEGRSLASPKEVPGEALRRARQELDSSQKPKPHTR